MGWGARCLRLARPGATPTDGVNLVDEHDAGRGLLGGGKQVAHAPRPHPHKHLLKLAACRWGEGWGGVGGGRVRPGGGVQAGGQAGTSVASHLHPQTS